MSACGLINKSWYTCMVYILLFFYPEGDGKNILHQDFLIKLHIFLTELLYQYILTKRFK